MKAILINRLFASCVLLALTLALFSFRAEKPFPGAGPFVAPASADTIKNILKGDANSVLEGKKLYTTYCVVCHGAKGMGDGVASAGLAKPPADHSSAAVQKQTDGALFWKLTQGNTPMPSYKASMTVTQRWQLVNYIRTLAKTSKK